MLSASNSATAESSQNNSTYVHGKSCLAFECKPLAVLKVSLDKAFLLFCGSSGLSSLALLLKTQICSQPSSVLSLVHPQTSCPLLFRNVCSQAPARLALTLFSLSPYLMYLCFKQGILPIFAPPAWFPALLGRHLSVSLNCESAVLCLHFLLSVKTF